MDDKLADMLKATWPVLAREVVRVPIDATRIRNKSSYATRILRRMERQVDQEDVSEEKLCEDELGAYSDIEDFGSEGKEEGEQVDADDTAIADPPPSPDETPASKLEHVKRVIADNRAKAKTQRDRLAVVMGSIVEGSGPIEPSERDNEEDGSSGVTDE